MANETMPQSETSKNPIEGLYFGVAEKTVSESPYVSASMSRPYNPDDLFQLRGDYAIYEDMALDDQVSVCQQIKRDLVLAGGWHFKVDQDTPEAEEIQTALEETLKNDLEIPLDQMLEEILSAYDFGFSLTEKVFKKKDDGTLGLGKLLTRHPATWLIHTDEYGKVTKYEQRGSKASLDIDPDSLIHYINQPRFQNPYGKSDLRAAYTAWFTKRQIIKYYAIYLEKSASPIPVARYNKNAPQAAVDAIFAALKSFQSKTALAIPEDIQVEFIKSQDVGQVYERAINLLNMFIGRALFIPDLMGFQGSETGGGSYSLGAEQINVMFKHVQRRRETLEHIVNRHIIWPIVVYNWGFLEKMPRWCLNPIKDENAVELARLWLDAVKGRVFKPSEQEINHFRAAAKFPEGDVEEAEQPELAPGMNPEQEKPEGEQEDEPKAEAEAKEPADETPKEDALEDAKEGEQKDYAKSSKLPPGEYHKKVNFAVIENSLDRFKEKVMAQSEPIVKKILNDLVAQVKRKKILQNQKVDKIGTLKLKYLGELRTAIKANLKEAYRDGQILGSQEILKGQYATPIEDEEFLAFLESELDIFIKDFEGGVLKNTGSQLVKAIKNGDPLSSIIDWIAVDGEPATRVQIERLARTKFTEVMNRGRRNFFEGTGVVAAYQYSAILDDVTTDICRGLDGKVFAAGDEPIPPLHWNCRSLLVPITKYESWEADEKVGKTPIEQFIDDNIGEGFSWYTAKSIDPPKPVVSVDDPRVEWERAWSDDTTEVVTYSLDGKPFRSITLKYTADKQEIISKTVQEIK